MPNKPPTMEQRITKNIYGEPIPVYDVVSSYGIETYRNYDDAYARFLFLLDRQ